MTTRAACAAVLITVGDRLPELHNEIGRRKYPADLDERVITLARDFERVLEQHGAAASMLSRLPYRTGPCVTSNWCRASKTCRCGLGLVVFARDRGAAPAAT